MRGGLISHSLRDNREKSEGDIPVMVVVQDNIPGN